MVAPPDSILVELGNRLLACADDELLDAPLDSLAGRVGDGSVRELLEEIHEAGDARSLRDLFSEGALERWLADVATDVEAQLLCAQLRGWLEGEGDDDPSRLARVAALPNDLDGLLAWARPYGLLEELSRPAREVVLDGAALTAATSIVECALGRLDPVGRGGSLLAASRATEETRAHLLRLAARRAAVSAREALWARALPEGPMRVLAERLRAVIAGVTIPSLADARFVPACRVSFDVESGIARGVLAGDAGPIPARLFLSGYEQRALHGECACSSPACIHLRALAGRLLDACLDGDDRLHEPLRSFTELPSWKRFLSALSPPEVATAPCKERLTFQVALGDERASVAIVVRRSLPDGRWSAGKRIAVHTAARGCAEHDRPVIDALGLAARSRGAHPVSADLAVLRALVEHPSVELDGEPLRVREEAMHVELIEQPGGLSVHVSLASARLAPGVRPADVSYVLHREPGTLVFAALTPSLRRLLAALASFRGLLPPESYPALAPWLASIGSVARVTAPKALRGTERPPPERLLLRITPGRDEGIDVALHMRALPMGPLWHPGRGPALSHGLERGAQVFVRRDLERERAIAERVIASLGLERHVRLEPFAYRIEGTQAALALLSEAARLTDVLELEWAERARLAVTSTVRGADLSIAVRKKGQWLAIEGGARLARGEALEADLAIGRLLDAARRGERFVRIEGGHYAEIERELFERLERAQHGVIERGREPAMSTAALPFWLEGLGARGADAPTREWLERARASASIDEARALERLGDRWRERLREYQRAGVAWLLDRSAWAPGAVLADEMGLGKTVQAIALLEARAALGPALVVAPTSVASNWIAELSRFAPGLSIRTPRAKPSSLGPGAVLVTSYDHLARRPYEGIVFATQIVDEAQMVKNARTQRAKAVASVDALFRVALSGTPIENRLGDLWSLFSLVAPGLLGSWTRFRTRFAAPIEREQDEERAAVLAALIAPFVLRRTKRDVAPELPSRTEVVHRVELSPAEQDLYDAAVRDARRALSRRLRDDSGRSARILAELTHLRQLACHPRLVVDDPRVESSKLHALLQLTADILPRGHRVLVFSQFTRHLALVREALERAGASTLYLDGATPAAERARLVERFQGGEGDVFLISLKAGGTGLNLTAADYVVHMDPWWNPAAEDQASDRAHRIGQERPITVVKLVAQGTIEEKVLGLHDDKRRLADSVLGGSAGALDLEALEGLLA